MRALVLALALLAGAKIWAQDRVYRVATEEALIAAYTERAAEACLREPQKNVATLAANAVAWTKDADARVVVGDDSLNVYFWEFGHELWTARYMKPRLVLNSPAGAECSYDLALGTAHVSEPSGSRLF